MPSTAIEMLMGKVQLGVALRGETSVAVGRPGVARPISEVGSSGDDAEAHHCRPRYSGRRSCVDSSGGMEMSGVAEDGAKGR